MTTVAQKMLHGGLQHCQRRNMESRNTQSLRHYFDCNVLVDGLIIFMSRHIKQYFQYLSSLMCEDKTSYTSVINVQILLQTQTKINSKL